MNEPDAYEEIRLKINYSQKVPIIVEDVAEYVSSKGYEVEQYPASEEDLITVIEQNPVIALAFDRPDQWRAFSGINTLGWYSSHVICGVGREGSNLRYFEPFLGEISVKSIASFRDIYGAGIYVVKPKKAA